MWPLRRPAEDWSSRKPPCSCCQLADSRSTWRLRLLKAPRFGHSLNREDPPLAGSHRCDRSAHQAFVRLGAAKRARDAKKHPRVGVPRCWKGKAVASMSGVAKKSQVDPATFLLVITSLSTRQIRCKKSNNNYIYGGELITVPLRRIDQRQARKA